MHRLENTDEGKFWEAWIKDETVFCYRFGKTGSPGHIKLKKFGSRADAEAELQSKLQEKLGEGFSECEASDEAAEATQASPRATNPVAKAPPKAAPPPDEAVIVAPPDQKLTPPRRKVDAPTAAALERARVALEALRAGLGKRSWQVGSLVRRARQALEQVADVDPKEHPALSTTFDALMATVVSTNARARLPLEDALVLLQQLRPIALRQALASWRPAGGPAAPSIAVIEWLVRRVRDPELALYMARLLSSRRAPRASFRVLWGRLAPAIAKSPVMAELAAIDPGNDRILRERITDGTTP